MAALEYLTVQDILWINLQVTRKVHGFHYAKLEEATYYQYGYGESLDLIPQAARFLSGFLRLQPLDAGNEATAFVGFAAFLAMNGHELNLADEQAAAWVGSLSGDKAAEAVSGVVREAHEDHHGIRADVRGAITEVLARYPKTVERLSGAAASA